MKEIGVLSWQLPSHEMYCKHFREIFALRKLPHLQNLMVHAEQMHRRVWLKANKISEAALHFYLLLCSSLQYINQSSGKDVVWSGWIWMELSPDVTLDPDLVPFL